MQGSLLFNRKNGVEGMFQPKHERPSTPEEVRKHCLNCSGMEDFIHGLQGEIQRLQNLTNDFDFLPIFIKQTKMVSLFTTWTNFYLFCDAVMQIKIIFKI